MSKQTWKPKNPYPLCTEHCDTCSITPFSSKCDLTPRHDPFNEGSIVTAKTLIRYLIDNHIISKNDSIIQKILMELEGK